MASSSILFISPSKIFSSSPSPISSRSPARSPATSQVLFSASSRTARMKKKNIPFIRVGPPLLRAAECYKVEGGGGVEGGDEDLLLDPSQQEKSFDSLEQILDSNTKIDDDESDLVKCEMLATRSSGAKISGKFVDSADLSGNNARKGLWHHFTGAHRRSYIEKMRGLYPNGDPPGLSLEEPPVFTTESERKSFEQGQKIKEEISKLIEGPSVVATNAYLFLRGMGMEGIIDVGLNLGAELLLKICPKPPEEKAPEAANTTIIEETTETTETETVTTVEGETQVKTVTRVARRIVFTEESKTVLVKRNRE